MIEPFVTMLAGGHPNSLGRTQEVVAHVLDAPARIQELLHAYEDADPVVRLRVSNALKRIEQQNHALMVQHLDAFLDKVIDLPTLGAQPSAQWTVAQICLALSPDLTTAQYARAKAHLMGNLATMTDWIVLAQTMETLSKWAQTDPSLARWLLPHLERQSQDPRPAVAKKARVCQQRLASRRREP